jgi:hypothetical protein
MDRAAQPFRWSQQEELRMNTERSKSRDGGKMPTVRPNTTVATPAPGRSRRRSPEATAPNICLRSSRRLRFTTPTTRRRLPVTPGSKPC